MLAAAAFFIDAVTMKFAQYQSDADGNLQIEIGWGLGGRAVVKDYSLDLDADGVIELISGASNDSAAIRLAA